MIKKEKILKNNQQPCTLAREVVERSFIVVSQSISSAGSPSECAVSQYDFAGLYIVHNTWPRGILFDCTINVAKMKSF